MGMTHFWQTSLKPCWGRNNMDTSFVIEPATLEDKDALLAMITKLQDAETTLHPSRRKGIEIAQDYYDFLQKNAAHILLCKTKTGTAGFVSGWIKEDSDFLQVPEWRHHGYVTDIFVDETYRKQGLGLQLLHEIEKALQDKGAKRLRICALYVNTQAIALYQKAGYNPFEVTYEKKL